VVKDAGFFMAFIKIFKDRDKRLELGIPYAKEHVPLKKRTARPAELDGKCQNSCYPHSIAWFHQYK